MPVRMVELTPPYCACYRGQETPHARWVSSPLLSALQDFGSYTSYSTSIYGVVLYMPVAESFPIPPPQNEVMVLEMSFRQYRMIKPLLSRTHPIALYFINLFLCIAKSDYWHESLWSLGTGSNRRWCRTRSGDSRTNTPPNHRIQAGIVFIHIL